MPDARLEVTDALGRRIVPIAKDAFEIGRRETNDLRLAGSEVSRDHAEIVAARTAVPSSAIAARGTAPTSTASRSPSGRSSTATASASDAAAAPRWSSCVADAAPPVERATTTAVGDLRQIAALLEGLRALGSGRVLDDVLALVLDSAIEVSGAERGFIMLAERDRRARVQAGARPRPDATLSGSSFATSRKIPEEVFRTGEPRIVADLLDGELANVHMGTVALGIRNVLCVPLRLVRYLDKAEAVGDERRIGVLYLDSREKGSLLSSSTRAALETLATEAAVAIENARLYRETMEKARMEQEMRIAAEIQQALLPEGGRIGRVLHGRRRVAALPIDRRRLLRLRRSAGRRARVRARRRRGQGAARRAAERDDAGNLRGPSREQRSAIADDHPRQPRALPPRDRVALRHADVRRASPGRPTDATATPVTIRRSSIGRVRLSGGSSEAGRSSVSSKERPTKKKR